MHTTRFLTLLLALLAAAPPLAAQITGRVEGDRILVPPEDVGSGSLSVRAEAQRQVAAEYDVFHGFRFEDRLAASEAGLIPARSQLPHEAQVALFMEMAEAVNATVERVADPGEVPARVAAYLRGHNLAQEVVRGADPWLAALPWDGEPQLATKSGRADGTEQAGLSRAFGGVAETGTLVMASGPDNPTTVNFLPEHHIVALRAEDVAGDYETVLGRIREAYGKGRMPRVVNMITGPSRSADIEQTLLLGAHGPRRLHIVVVG